MPDQRQSLPKATKRARRETPLPPALLEFQSPSAAIIATPVPLAARGTIWVVTSMVIAVIGVAGLIPVDKVVTAQGKVVADAATIVVQPLETSIVRQILVKEGQIVHAGDLLARLDPTFATADAGSLRSQVDSLQAEVGRLQAELQGKPFTYTGLDPNMALQAAIFAQRQAEHSFRMETYRQKINGLQTTVQRSVADADAYRQRLGVARDVEKMRTELQNLQVGSRLNTLGAVDNRLEMERGLANALNTAESARRDLDSMSAERDAYDQQWRADASQQLSDQTRKLSDAQESLHKADLRQQLVELKADKDATVLTVAKVSVGSVMQSGDQFITLVPLDAPLEVEANLSGRDTGFVRVGNPVEIKFDAFEYARYGLAEGTVRTISADSFSGNPDDRSGRTGAPQPQQTEPFYRTRIAIDRLDLHDLPSDFHLTPGMPVTADIKVGKRTVMAYMLSRIVPTLTEGLREP